MSDANQDPYLQYMEGTDEVLHRQKMHWPWYFYLLLGVVFSIGLGALFAAAAPLLPFLLMLAAMAIIFTTFYALRVSVTQDHVFVQYGLLGPKIRVEDIVHCEAEDYNILKYGGYGIRYSVVDGSWAFNMMGDKGKAVRIHYKTAMGIRKLVVSSTHPLLMADAINRARHAKGHDVDLPPDDAELGLGDDFQALSDAQTPLYEEHFTPSEPKEEEAAQPATTTASKT